MTALMCLPGLTSGLLTLVSEVKLLSKNSYEKCHNSIEYVVGCRDKCLSWKMEIDYDLGCVHLGCVIHEH